MVKLLLGLAAVPSPHDAADALAVAICHVHSQPPGARSRRRGDAPSRRPRATSWRALPAAALTPVIAHLRGRLLEKQPNRIVVDVGGVGYDVAVPLSTFYGLGEPGARGRAAHPHARARGRARALRIRDRCSSRSCSSG